jgi:hypothetical protein
VVGEGLLTDVIPKPVLSVRFSSVKAVERLGTRLIISL